MSVINNIPAKTNSFRMRYGVIYQHQPEIRNASLVAVSKMMDLSTDRQ